MNMKNETLCENKADVLLPFQLESCAMRGRLVRLGSAIDTIIKQHAYPAPVAGLLGQATALAAALGSALKFEGVFTLQAKSDGAVSMLVADVTTDGAVRAYAQFDANRLGESSLLGSGHLVFTVDQTLSDERYQGIVKLEGDSLTEAFQAYFKQSEQIPTGLLVAAQQAQDGWRAACLMIQQMPREGGHEVSHGTSVQDDWLRVMSLMQTCTESEMTDDALAPEDLLYRLFHEEGVRVYDKKAFFHACRCSRERISGVLESLPPQELQEMIVNGEASVTCQFCGRVYAFTESDITSL